MRIRKNAKLVLAGGSSSSSPATRPYIICELNRSPWDVDDATFSLLQQDDDAAFPAFNGGSLAADSLPPSESHESMELSFEKNPSLVKHEKQTDDEIDAGLQAAIGLSALKRGNINSNGNININNNTLCDELKNQLWFHPQQMGKQTCSQVAQKKRGRPKKPRASLGAGVGPGANNNPYEFYYYSGFGPRWGKRRGGGNNEEESNAAGDTQGSSSSTSQAMSEDENDNNNVRGEYDNDNCKDEDNGVYLVEGEGKRELDYLDDDDEEESYACGRRVRKPIKARSLKSLM